MIIGRDLMVQLGLSDDLNCQFFQWDGVIAPMKEPIGLLGKPDLSSYNMCKVVMHNREPVSAREDTEILVKILRSIYAKAELKQVNDNANQLKYEEINQLPSLLEYFKELSGGTRGYWDTEPIDLELRTCYTPFNCKYYPVPRINKEKFRKELKD